MPTEHIKYEDTLRQGTDKINNAIDQANKAEEDSAEALTTANQALEKSESTQTQLDQVVIDGDSSVEAAQARVDTDGVAHTTLKERLDSEHTEVTAQLADIEQYFEDKASMGDLYELRAQRRKGRTVLNATDLVSLDVGDDPAKDNTDALEELLARETRDEEIIRFPKGVIYTDRIYLTDDIYWLGSDDEPTVIKLRPQSNNENYSLIAIEDVHNGTLERIIFDATKDTHTNFTGDRECLDFDNGSSGWLLWEISANNAEQDGFDHDSSKNNIHVFCTTDGCKKDGFHNSSQSANNWYYYCQATNTGAYRGGFTNSQHSLGGHVFVGCVASHCETGFGIEKRGTIASNTVINCVSINNRLDDVVDGISSGTSPTSINQGFHPINYTTDLNHFPRKTGVFSVGASTPNLPNLLDEGNLGATLIQNASTATDGTGIVRQIVVKGRASHMIIYSREIIDGDPGRWAIMAVGNQTFGGDLDDITDLSGALYVGSSAANRPDGSSSGTLVTSSSTGGISQAQIFTDGDDLYIRDGAGKDWKTLSLSHRSWDIDFDDPPTDVTPTTFYTTAGGSSNQPENKTGTLSYSVSDTGRVMGMSFVTVDGDMYIRGDVEDNWKKVVTE